MYAFDNQNSLENQIYLIIEKNCISNIEIPLLLDLRGSSYCMRGSSKIWIFITKGMHCQTVLLSL